MNWKHRKTKTQQRAIWKAFLHLHNQNSAECSSAGEKKNHNQDSAQRGSEPNYWKLEKQWHALISHMKGCSTWPTRNVALRSSHSCTHITREELSRENIENRMKIKFLCDGKPAQRTDLTWVLHRCEITCPCLCQPGSMFQLLLELVSMATGTKLMGVTSGNRKVCWDPHCFHSPPYGLCASFAFSQPGLLSWDDIHNIHPAAAWPRSHSVTMRTLLQSSEKFWPLSASHPQGSKERPL